MSLLYYVSVRYTYERVTITGWQ